MKFSISEFGKLPNGKEAKLFSFTTQKGMVFSITNYGGIITSILMPDKNGDQAEITAGFPTLDQYIKGHPHFGVIAGRFANRIGGASFIIDDTQYKLPANNGPNQLHGGNNGFHTKLWDYRIDEKPNEISLSLGYKSPDLEEGFPGNLDVVVTYTISDSNEMAISYEAETDKPTHVNLTNHAYYNLNGFKNTVHDHDLRVEADSYVEIDDQSIPTGKLNLCSGSLFDLTEERNIASSIDNIPGGLDHCYVLRNPNDLSKPAAVLSHNPSGRKITVFTNQPGIQVYTGNSLDSAYTGHNGTVYHKHMAVCLETQHFPDSPNQPQFPKTLLRPGEKYNYKARFVFSVDK